LATRRLKPFTEKQRANQSSNVPRPVLPGRAVTGRDKTRPGTHLLSIALVTVVVAAGCGRGRPTRPSPAVGPPAPLEVKLVWHLGLSASGDWLTFESLLQRGPKVTWSVSWLIPASGGSPELLEPVEIGSTFPVWSPSTDELAYIRVGYSSSVRARAPEDLAAKLSVDFSDLWLSQLSWSPDGTRLACLVTDLTRRRREPVVIDAATGERHFARLRVPATVSPLAFTTSGEGLLFARGGPLAEPGREPRLYFMQASTTSAEMTDLAVLEAELCQVAVPVDDGLLLQLLHTPATRPAGGPPVSKELVLLQPAGQEGAEVTVSSLGEGSIASAQSLRRRQGHLEVIMERAGDLFIRSLEPRSEEEPLRVTETSEMEAGAIFGADGQSIYFVRAPKPHTPPTQVVLRSLADGQETVIADVTPELVKQAARPSLGTQPAP